MKHVVVIPYHNYAEIKRYLWIANFLQQFTVVKSEYEFLLTASSFIKPSSALFRTFSLLAPVKSYQCRRKVRGFPQGPCAMFWEIMEYINKNYEKDGRFVLWLESDMIPVKRDWIDRLVSEWMLQPDTVLIGRYIPKTYRKRRLYCREHINGGACYAKNLTDFVPAEARRPAFDENLFPYIKETKRFKKSESFAFTHMYNLWQSIRDPEKVILHGFRQNKNKFIRRCIKIIQDPTLQKDEVGIQRIIPKRLRRCCCTAYWNGFSLTCPIHQAHNSVKDFR